MLDQDALTAALETLPGWALRPDGRSIARKVVFADFRQAFAFMTQVAVLAEEADHHPDWSNVYSRVTISLSTHDAGGVTAKDIALAYQINQVLDQFVPSPDAGNLE